MQQYLSLESIQLRFPPAHRARGHRRQRLSQRLQPRRGLPYHGGRLGEQSQVIRSVPYRPHRAAGIQPLPDLSETLLPMPPHGQRPAPQGEGLCTAVWEPLVGSDGHGGLGVGLGQGRLPAQVMQYGREVQGDTQTQGVCELLREGQGRLTAGYRLVRVPEKPQGRRGAIVAAHPRVVPAIEGGMGPMPLRVIEPQPLCLMRPHRGQLATTEQAGPHGMVGLEEEVRVVQALGQAQELLPQRLHSLILPAGVRRAPESPQHAEELRWLSDLLTQCAGAGVQPFHLGGPPALGRLERHTKGQLHRQLLLAALVGL